MQKLIFSKRYINLNNYRMKISKQNKNGKIIKLYRIKTFALKKINIKKDPASSS